jgi:hypothetical protein
MSPFSKDPEARSLEEAIFESFPEGLVLLEIVRDGAGEAIDFRWLRCNPAVERVSGLPPQAMVGRRASELFSTHLSPWVALYVGVADSGRPKRITKFVTELDRTWDLRIFPFAKDRVLVVFDDVTEQLRAEETLRSTGAREAFLLALSDAFEGLRTAEDVLAVACRLLGEHLDLDRVHFAEFDWHVLRAKVRAEHLRGAQTTVGVHELAGLGDILDAIRRGDPAFVDDVDAVDDMSAGTRALLASLAIRAYGSSPCFAGRDAPVWALGVASSVPRAWTVEEMALVAEVSERTWRAIERLEAERAARAEAERSGTRRVEAGCAVRRRIDVLERALSDGAGKPVRAALEELAKLARDLEGDAPPPSP